MTTRGVSIQGGSLFGEDSLDGVFFVDVPLVVDHLQVGVVGFEGVDGLAVEPEVP